MIFVGESSTTQWSYVYCVRDVATTENAFKKSVIKWSYNQKFMTMCTQYVYRMYTRVYPMSLYTFNINNK